MKLAYVEKISRALADQTRLMIFQAISARRKMTCSEIATMRGVTQATVSHHLKILADAGLIESQRQGQFVCSRVIPETVEQYTRALAEMTRAHKRSQRR